jgi:hypothetical protein
MLDAWEVDDGDIVLCDAGDDCNHDDGDEDDDYLPMDLDEDSDQEPPIDAMDWMPAAQAG